MKLIRTIIASALLATSGSIAIATECTGNSDVNDIVVGCDGEVIKSISLAKCDFRADKIPDVTILSVIDGRGSDITSVTLDSTQPGSFTVLIRPKPRLDNAGICQVQNFDWVAE